jgi:hypothetical protein|nr:MAG TPA: hypothetical protein [Caudoviricetes sp.]
MKNNNYPNWLVPFKIAKELKNIGFYKKCYFNKDTDGVYIESILKASERGEFLAKIYTCDIESSYYTIIPTWEQVFEWFRDKGLHSHIEYTCDNDLFKINIIGMLLNTNKSYFKTYEEARKALINELINIKKIKKDENK